MLENIKFFIGELKLTFVCVALCLLDLYRKYIYLFICWNYITNIDKEKCIRTISISLYLKKLAKHNWMVLVNCDTNYNYFVRTLYNIIIFQYDCKRGILLNSVDEGTHSYCWDLLANKKLTCENWTGEFYEWKLVEQMLAMCVY